MEPSKYISIIIGKENKIWFLEELSCHWCFVVKGTPNESTDHPEIDSGAAEIVETKYENIKEIGPKYEVEKTKFTHIEKHHQTKAAESSERYCVKVIGTTSEFTIY